jgi:hypothetical protein
MRAMKRLALGGRRRVIAGAIAVGVLGVAAFTILRFVTGSIAGNPVMRQAVGLALTDERVLAVLGSPVTEPGMPRGHVQCSLLRKQCSIDAAANLSGTTRLGTLHVKGQRDSKGWQLTTAVVLVDGSSPIDLLRGREGNVDQAVR